MGAERSLRSERHSGPAAVLWDMDGTLVDSEKLWTVSLVDTAHWLGGELSQSARDAMIGSNMARTLVLMFDDLGVTPEPEQVKETERYLSDRTAELFAQGLPWRPGAQEALQLVGAAGWPMALVTNTGRSLTESALDSIGRGYFAATVCADEVPHGKPDPDPYLRAAALLGLAPAECLAIEDSPNGARAAQRAGVAVLVVPCDVPVPAEPGLVLRASLAGLTLDDLRADYAQAREGRAA
ncbi:MAG TPA: HAD family hydrolase [Pseudonocardia sp.]